MIDISGKIFRCLTCRKLHKTKLFISEKGYRCFCVDCEVYTNIKLGLTDYFFYGVLRTLSNKILDYSERNIKEQKPYKPVSYRLISKK